jgi:hypothetical protein
VIFPLNQEQLFAIAAVKDHNHLASVLILERDELFLVRQAAISAGIIDIDGNPTGSSPQDDAVETARN